MHITKAERLLLIRRRRGETQKAAAKRYNIPLGRYLKHERGALACKLLIPSLGHLRCHERLILARRRVGMTQTQVAEAIGHCRRWIIMMERGEVSTKKLEEYWSE